MHTLTWQFNIEGELAWVRLLVAVVLSFALHLILLVGVPVNLTGGVPDVSDSVIIAQIMPAPAAGKEISQFADDTQLLPQTIVSPQPAEHSRAAALPSSPSAGIKIPLIRDPAYYPANQLDVKPTPLASIKPAYPGAALDAGINNGVVTLLLLIDEFGIVNEVSVVNAAPPGYFEDAAMAAFRAAHFEPARRQGHPVKCRIAIKVNFDYEAEQRETQR
jgi:periplasmic protein TonB